MTSLCQGKYLQASEQDAQRIVSRLAVWEQLHGRRPPWRWVPEPYLLAAAEILLQKTKARDVEEVWLKFKQAYPTPDTLLVAADEEVAQIVGGLGLRWQRTRRLKAMAAAFSAGTAIEHLPGLGNYGIGVLAVSGGRLPEKAPVDGNVARVIGRIYGFTFARGEARKKPEIKNAVMNLLSSHTARGQEADVLYGLVDLGATVCTPGKRNCNVCPLAADCASSLVHLGEC